MSGFMQGGNGDGTDRLSEALGSGVNEFEKAIAAFKAGGAPDKLLKLIDMLPPMASRPILSRHNLTLSPDGKTIEQVDKVKGL